MKCQICQREKEIKYFPEVELNLCQWDMLEVNDSLSDYGIDVKLNWRKGGEAKCQKTA